MQCDRLDPIDVAYVHENDPFVLANSVQRSWLIAAHKQVRKQLVQQPVIHKPFFVKNEFGNWRDEVVNWYNEWVLCGSSNDYTNLYLYGISKSGKTNFIHFLLGMCCLIIYIILSTHLIPFFRTVYIYLFPLQK